jgi:hypothetical protein
MNISRVKRIQKTDLWSCSSAFSDLKKENLRTDFSIARGASMEMSRRQIRRRDCDPSSLIETSQCRRTTSKIWSKRNRWYSTWLSNKVRVEESKEYHFTLLTSLLEVQQSKRRSSEYWQHKSLSFLTRRFHEETDSVATVVRSKSERLGSDSQSCLHVPGMLH